jgi:hypothetical protein
MNIIALRFDIPGRGVSVPMPGDHLIERKGEVVAMGSESAVTIHKPGAPKAAP